MKLSSEIIDFFYRSQGMSSFLHIIQNEEESWCLFWPMEKAAGTFQILLPHFSALLVHPGEQSNQGEFNRFLYLPPVGKVAGNFQILPYFYTFLEPPTGGKWAPGVPRNCGQSAWQGD